MIDLTTIVWFVIYLLGAAAVFGILRWIINENPWISPGWKPTINYIFLVLIGLFVIGVIITFISGKQLIRMN